MFMVCSSRLIVTVVRAHFLSLACVLCATTLTVHAARGGCATFLTSIRLSVIG
jgi:hypothetical protein